MELSETDSITIKTNLREGTNQGLAPYSPSFLDIILYFVYDILLRMRVIKKKYVNRKIRNFDEVVANQPMFFISRKSWENLKNGVSTNIDGSVNNWVQRTYPNFDVFGFVFCVGFHRTTQGYYGWKPNTEAFKNGKAYFRIRTILKEKKGTKIIIEIDNIAYVDLGVALANAEKYQNQPIDFLDKPEVFDCLRFITKDDLDNSYHIQTLNTIINENIVRTIDTHGSEVPPDNIPVGFNPKNVDKEGNYFGANRIWNQILIRDNPKAPGTFITLAFNGNAFLFNFKVNPEFETDLPCPTPPVCG